MKSLFYIFILLFSVSLTAQERVAITGKITPPLGEDPQGISIINRTAKSATISNELGNFNIRVAAGDTLHFSALQYQDFSVIIDDGVVENRQLNVFISESVTQLPEVVVTPYDLSGNVEVDVSRIPVADTSLPTKSAAEINPYEHTFRPDSLTSPANAAMREAMIYNGANFANIFRNIFTTRSIMTDIGGKEELDEQVLQLYDDDFFQENLNIQKDNIYEFIYFAEDNGLSPEMLKEENELQLIEFLVRQSQRYRERKAEN